MKKVAIVGAGMVGLSTAWFLQQRGAQVTVYDRHHVGAGASWGNAGWLTPALTAPLPEPAVLRYGVRALFSPASPVYVPLRPDLTLIRFLSGFARHSTGRRWALGARAYAPINRAALDAFDELTAGQGSLETRPADPFLACFQTLAERDALIHELEGLREGGQEVKYALLSGEEVRSLEPTISRSVTAAVHIQGQRYLNPPAFLSALAGAVSDRYGDIVEGAAVRDVTPHADSVVLTDVAGRTTSFDAVVLATGAWLGQLGRPLGIRRPVQAGRGYSFSVPAETMPSGPVYFPGQRVACTPLDTADGPRLRIAGMMEFRRPESPLDPRRIQAIVEATRPMLQGLDLSQRGDEWVGSRPVTADGLPLIGQTASSRVFVAGGHGMWGIVLGPVTGKLLAEQIITGRRPAELTPFDPLR
jgi:D-amino-acid dehydrogenase